MKHENGIWLYRGKIYDTLHDALQAAWDKKLEVRNDNLLAVYRPCAGFYYNSMDMPGGGSDVQEVEEPMRLIDADKLKIDMEQKALCGEGAYKIFGYSAEQVDSLPTIALPPNDPLTLDELREMDGEPVWVVIDGDDYAPCWMLLKYHAGRAFYSECFSVGLDNYGKGWTAYRRGPEEEKR